VGKRLLNLRVFIGRGVKGFYVDKGECELGTEIKKKKIPRHDVHIFIGI